MLLLLLGLPVLVAAVVAFLLARKVHDSFMQKGSPNYVGYSVLTFIGTFLVIGGLLFLLIASNISWGR